MRRLARPLLLSSFTLVSLCAGNLEASDGVTETGGGAGVMVSGDQVGPVVELHASHGLNDYFDGNLELTGARPVVGEGGSWGVTLAGGATYKLDVFEWIPYVGALLGFGWYRQDGSGATASEPLIAVPFGLEYLVSRDLALGAEGRFQLLLRTPEAVIEQQTWMALLRVGYRFGY